jgi:outer membrane protein assembly factor BamD (BamD/ComL family)
MTLLLLVACGQEKGKESESNENPDPSYLDDQLTNEDGTINAILSDSAAALYFQAYERNAKDSIGPYYLMKSADIHRHVPGKALMAVKRYLTLVKKYPQHDLAPVAQFMTGLTFDENLNDKARASKVYEDFLKLYPNHPMAAEAENLLALANDSEESDLDKVHEWMKNEQEEK